MRMRSAAARPPTIRARLTDGHRRVAPREQAHSVVQHQLGYRPQRDAGEGQIACLPGEVGDSDDQRDGRSIVKLLTLFGGCEDWSLWRLRPGRRVESWRGNAHRR